MTEPTFSPPPSDGPVPNPGVREAATPARVSPTFPSATDETIWTPERIKRLGMTTDVETAGAILGIGRTKAYELAKSGQFPTRILHIGRRYLIPVPALLRLLDAE
jgi:hypothetical protein